MQELSGFPYFEVEFNKDGKIFDLGLVQNVIDGVRDRGITDLFVISHGWNNDKAEARVLYAAFFGWVRNIIDTGGAPGVAERKYGVLGVFWPSKKFAESELVAGGGAASLGGGMGDAELVARLDELKGAFDAEGADDLLEQAKTLIPRLEDSPSARDQFVDLVRQLFPPAGELEEEIPSGFFEEPGRDLLERLGTPLDIENVAPVINGGAATSIGDMPPGIGGMGNAAGIGDFFNNIKTGVQNILNYTTYYQMKERAGKVGRNGVNMTLRELRLVYPELKIHLIGHSFGGRVVTSAADGPDDKPVIVVNSMMLLQAAFSHNGFSGDYDGTGSMGFFRKVITDSKISGPVLVSHSIHDSAVGTAYPLASRISREVAAALGDANDKYGGIGRNGAQKTAEAIFGDLLPPGGAYAFQSGHIYNLKADDYIKDHSDICSREVAHALLASVACT